MKKRLLFLTLIIFVAICIFGCGSKQVDNSSVSPVKSSSITTKNKPDVAGKTETSKKTSAKETSKSQEVSVTSPSGKTISTNNRATLMITRDFGSKIITNKQVNVGKDDTIIDILKSAAKTTTKWDGSFIQSINGLESNNGGLSGKRLDWFFFVNGICADVGAAEYDLSSGEIVWWDYHPWKSMGLTNSAVIGCYPEPFVHGYRGKVSPTTIMSSAENHNLAGNLQKALQARGVRSVKIKELNNNLLGNRQVPTIVIGTWDELQQLGWLDNYNKAYRKTGIGVHFSDKGLDLLDYSGSIAQNIDVSAGVITASGAGLGDPNTLWMIAGTDQEGLQQAVNILVNNPQKIHGFYNAAVVSGKVIRLPLQ